LAVALAFALAPRLTYCAESKVPVPSPCKYQQNCQCTVPGITIRWKAAYCMYLNETDDLENAGVQLCLARAEPDSVEKLGACEQNAHWKKMICGVRHEDKKRQVQKCVQDRRMIPRFVEVGAP
jgi:hypothetical protein